MVVNFPEILTQHLPRTASRLRRDLLDGLHLGGQIFVQRGPEVVVDVAFGEDSPGQVLTSDHLMPWLSATKPLAAVAVMQQVQAYRLSLETPVADVIPEFAVQGKAGIRVAHLLTHTAGIRGADLGWKPTTWSAALEQICGVRPEPRWEPGAKAGYHVDSLAYLQGELVRRLAGCDFQDYLTRHIFHPLGMDSSFVGIPDRSWHEHSGRLARLWNTAGPHTVEKTEYRERPVASLCRPGGNGRGPARELAAFYLDLLSPESRLLSREWISAMTARVRKNLFDHTFRHIMDWGLGFAVSSNRYGPDTVPYNFGRRCSDKTFGHCGNQCTAAFADPVHQLVVVVLFNGQPGEEKHQTRMRETLDAIYFDLGI
jgi:CubicO group peptidase (beta-lactamase class C family)